MRNVVVVILRATRAFPLDAMSKCEPLMRPAEP